MFSLNSEFELGGIKAPLLIWGGAFALVAVAMGLLVRLALSVRRELARHGTIMSGLDALRDKFPRQGTAGLALEGFNALEELFKDTAWTVPWSRYKAHVLFEQSQFGEEQAWAAESAEVGFTEAAVTDSRLNRSFYAAVPGLVTSLGLLLTFIAILLALLDVRVDQNQVRGLEGLVAGLSGKFISSVVALAAASLFLVSERHLLHGLSKSRHDLVAAIDDLVPRRTDLHVLSDLRRDMAQMSDAFRHFNSDLSVKMRQSFSESMGPTLQRMADTIYELNQLLRAAEAQKQESITGSVESLLRSLEDSMRTSLAKMGEQFSESISGGATQHFDEVARSLTGTAKLLEDMNSQSQGTQAGLNELVRFARDSTAEQMALGKTQVEELSQVLRGLMTQLQETTGSSLSGMTAALTGVVHDLSNKVTDLGDRMATTMTQTSGQATAAATNVVEQARTWSEQNAAQLAELLSRHEGHVQRIEDLRSVLEGTIAQFRTGIHEYGTTTGELRQAAVDVHQVVARAADAANTMRDIHNTLQVVAQKTGEQVDRLAESARRQEETWRHIDDNLRQYEATFGRVDKSAGELLENISRNLRDYTATSRKAFDDVVSVSNDHMGTAVQKLGGAISELEEHLTNLSEVFGKARSKA